MADDPRPAPQHSRAPSRARTALSVALVVAGVVVAGLLVWRLSEVILLFFAAVLVAIILHTIATGLRRLVPVPLKVSLVVAGILVAGLLAALFYLLGAQIGAQSAELFRRLPALVDQLGRRLHLPDLWPQLLGAAQGISASGLKSVFSTATSLFGGIASALVVLAAGIYLAANPAGYRDGLLLLVPPEQRGKARQGIDHIGEALQRWLLGQVVAMALVGLVTGVGLLIIGVPSALALAFIATVLEFVPIVGPVASTIPALLVALPLGWSTFFWVLALYIFVQQIEAVLITPLVQRQTVQLPPVLILFAIIALGILFGTIGILLSGPLSVLLYFGVKELYVRDAPVKAGESPG